VRSYAERVNELAAWWRRWRETTSHDIVSAVAVTAVLVAGAYGEAHPIQPSDQVVHGHVVPQTPVAAFLLVGAACLVLVAKRRYPITVLAISTCAAAVYSLLGYVNGAVVVAPTIAMYSVARSINARKALLLAAGTIVVLMGATVANNPLGPTGGGLYLIPAEIAVASFAGIAISSRRAYLISVKERAADEARRLLDEERLRIARELHDVVAHTMATISVQAGAAAHVLADRPEAAAEAIQTIRIASKDGLRELRAILNVLRRADEGESTRPVPRLAQIDVLIAGASRAGLPTALNRLGEPRPLPAAIDLTAYRIIQESLTNAIRHAGSATATVTLDYDETVLRVAVTDTGRGVIPGANLAADNGAGHGLVGMRERAETVGGEVHAGPAPGGGFQVIAELPIDQEQAMPTDVRSTGATDAAKIENTAVTS
jgi:signal transduction histidine kinase